MKQTTDWTGHIEVTPEPGRRLVRRRDWTGHPIVSSKKDRRDRGKWIGPAILAVALTYVGLVWLLSKWLGTLLGDRWTWLPPLVLGCGVTVVPFVGFILIVATAEEGLMTPLGYCRYLRKLRWSDSSSSSDSAVSDSWTSAGSGGGGSFGGGGDFGGGGGGASW
jgi:uncharacterized membrane protein YgcG